MSFSRVIRFQASRAIRHTTAIRAQPTLITPRISSALSTLPQEQEAQLLVKRGVRHQSTNQHQQPPNSEGDRTHTNRGADADKPPEPPTASNIALGLVLFGFIWAVYQYTMQQMKATDALMQVEEEMNELEDKNTNEEDRNR
eukprot:gb/GECG01001385.1/.p1 GENE.gb/GECG01001385.1/~~gb/GECG01001385.1/.p1  ORF type:complete len:142 (+),score=16.87 gb/GECG01001385.1/:1-426(+)